MALLCSWRWCIFFCILRFFCFSLSFLFAAAAALIAVAVIVVIAAFVYFFFLVFCLYHTQVICGLNAVAVAVRVLLLLLLLLFLFMFTPLSFAMTYLCCRDNRRAVVVVVVEISFIVFVYVCFNLLLLLYSFIFDKYLLFLLVYDLFACCAIKFSKVSFNVLMLSKSLFPCCCCFDCEYPSLKLRRQLSWSSVKYFGVIKFYLRWKITWTAKRCRVHYLA